MLGTIWLRRAIAGWFFALVALVGCLAPRAAWAAPWSIGPRPTWISPVEIPRAKGPTGDGHSGGVRPLLADNQQRFVGKTEESYRRFADEIVNEAGLAALSSLSVQVDPSYETLVLHDVRVWRGDRVGSRLSRERVRVMQREPGLQHDVVDGVLTVALFVEDLRIGDVVEWSYTLRGADPTLGGKIDRRLYFGGAEPFGRIHARLLVDETRVLRFAAASPDGNTEAYRANRGSVGGLAVYEWDFIDVAGSKPQPESPSWFPSEASVQVSESASWAEVAALSTSQFRPTGASSKELRAWVKQARSAFPSDDDLLLHAIRFVQDEVRYVGLEEGLGRRHPTAPSKVLERRFGDCKDKASLLVALLAEAGIEAHPALVSTTHGHVLADRLPSLGVFDHAIVQVRAKSGKIYWVDATLRLQGGGLERLRFGEFERALVLGVDATDFARMDPAPATVSRVTAVDRFELPAPTSKEKARIDVERIYSGPLADAFRLVFAANGSDELSKHFAEVYRAEYPDTSVAANADIRDDRAGDTFGMTIHLASTSAWVASTDGTGHTFTAFAHLVGGNLPSLAPDEGPRLAPFLIPGPAEAHHRLEVSLPFDPSFEPAKKTTSGTGFTLVGESTVTGRKVVYDHRLVTTETLVPPAEGDATRAQLRAVREEIAHTLTHGMADAVLTPATGPVGAYLFFVLAIAVPLALWIGFRVYRHDPDLPVPPASEHQPLGGWLLLLAFGLLSGPFTLGKSIYEILVGLVPASAWDPYFAAGTKLYSPSFAAWMGIETIIELGRLAYVSVLAVLFFGRRRSFPLHFTRYGVFTIAYLWLDHVLTGALTPPGLAPPADNDVYRLLGSSIWMGLWIAYLRQSDRARRVFVRGLRSSRVALPPTPVAPVTPVPATEPAGAAPRPASPAPTYVVDDEDDDDDHRRRI